MKIALYIEDGLEQIVLTPESDTERGILGKFHDGSRALSIERGSFYECRGGWVRHRYGSYSGLYGNTSNDDDSTMIVLRAASVDRSGEAGETRSEAEGLDPKDDSPALKGDAPNLSPSPLPPKEPHHG